MNVNVYVVTRAPMDSGNMALFLPYFSTEEDDQYGIPKVADVNAIAERIRKDVEAQNNDEEYAKRAVREFMAMVMNLRAPVFQPGEILLLGDDGREVTHPGRKPGKWDVDVQHVGNTDTHGVMKLAIELSQRITDELSEAGDDPDVLAAIKSIKEQV